MAEVYDWSADADDNNQAPPIGAPENMLPSGLNNVMREGMATNRRAWEAISGELDATGSAEGALYTIRPEQTVTTAQQGLRFAFTVDMDCAADPQITYSGVTARIKKITPDGLANLEAGELLSGGTYECVYRAGSNAGFVILGAVDTPLTADDIPDLPASKVTSEEFDVARIPDLPASKVTSEEFALDRIPTITNAKIEGMAADKLTGIVPDANLPASDVTDTEFEALEDRVEDLEDFFLTSRKLARRTTVHLLSTSYQEALSRTITPHSATSRILLVATLMFDAVGQSAAVKLFRGSTELLEVAPDTAKDSGTPWNIYFADTPGVATEQTYSLQVKGPALNELLVGSSLYAENMTAGHVLGVVGSDVAVTQQAFSYTTVVSATITPSSTQSIIHLQPRFLLSAANTSENDSAVFGYRIKRGGTVLFDEVLFQNRDILFQSVIPHHSEFHDTPGSTAAQTYTVEAQSVVAVPSRVVTVKTGSSLELRDKSLGA